MEVSVRARGRARKGGVIMEELAKKTVAALTECVEALGKSGNEAQANMISIRINALVEILKVIPDRYLYISR